MNIISYFVIINKIINCKSNIYFCVVINLCKFIIFLYDIKVKYIKKRGNQRHDGGNFTVRGIKISLTAQTASTPLLDYKGYWKHTILNSIELQSYY